MRERTHRHYLRAMGYTEGNARKLEPPPEPTIMFLLFTGETTRKPLCAVSVERSGTRWTFTYAESAGMVTRMLICNCDGYFLTGIWVGDSENHIVDPQPLGKLERAGLAFVRYIPELRPNLLGRVPQLRVAIDTVREVPL